jgi:HEAT repeat protein
MKAEQRLFLGLLVLPMFMAGGFASVADEREKVDELIGKLGQGDWQNAVDALVKIGEPAVEPLIRTLQDRNIKTWAIHARTVDVLAKIGSQQAVDAVIKSIEDSGLNPYVRAAAARSLGQIKAENAADSLIDALKDESWIVRLNAREALLQIGELTVEQVITALKDKNSTARWQAAWVLGRIKTEKAIEPLIEALADGDWMVRDEAAVALTKINSEKVIELLTCGGANVALKNEAGYVREQVAWILSRIESNKAAKEEPSPGKATEKKHPKKIYCGQKEYLCYPATLDTKPDIPSPHTTLDSIEVVTAFTKDGKYALIPVTVENGKPLNYKQNQWGKGRQLQIDAGDFPVLARTGLHLEAELNRTKMITGRSIVEIAELGRPGRSSGAGFMSDDEDIISVLKGDNHLVEQLGLRHPRMAGPLFRIWNMILKDVELRRLGRFWEPFEYILYKGKKVCVKAEGTKGWQESLFEDEILGKFQIEIWREPDQNEKAFLREKYPDLTNDQMAAMLKKLSHIYSGEMVPYYIMRYGFYEGHTDYRADPVAIAWIFGLRSLEQIEATFPGRLEEVLTRHFTRQ